ncbi:fatty-acid amide hydrolase 2-A [Venturia canescens]|uniref:fatty-acid amide hydrolase 2-A n=1 Tax=Venturia canescens TaxID=32260 RepID=UPI001C9BCEA5|nr:fatty-acid amide hydrolase 2-A [Venturia canescens]XP_043274620.1 fatty-acid amide hydrolase 2-A [Venturia canescens]XP_043274621.1 fatty-acid amide hydrolase 2-A [Venturia canescens]
MSTKGYSAREKKMKVSHKIIGLVHRLVEFVGRFIFLLAAYISGPGESQPPITDMIHTLRSCKAIAMMIREKRVTATSVVQAYIDRIKEVQPILNCVCEDRFDEALNEARKCDELLASPSAPSSQILAEKKPFFGVPFTTKDCIGISGMKQTAGLVLRKNTVADRDAEVIRLMRAAGAIPLATTNVSELAMWWETGNCLYGTTRNPYNTRHIVGGSSGGEGCIQAAAASQFGIGSDIGGSIRIPCFFNGIFGHKPSKGVVSNDGQYPNPHSEDQDRLLGIGPMCRYATDLAPILKVLAGENASMLNLDEKVDISKLKVYYMLDDGGQLLVSPVDHEIKDGIKRVVKYLETAHKVKAKKVEIKKMKKSLALWLANMTSPDGKDFAHELANRKGRISLGWEFLKWFTRTGSHTFIALVTAAFEMFKFKHDSEERTTLIQQSRELYQEFKDMLGDDGVFLYPTHPTAAPLHHEPLIKPFNFAYTGIINILGLPATACPLGLNKQGLPIGLQVVAGHLQDHLSLAVAVELENAFGGWVLPAISY